MTFVWTGGSTSPICFVGAMATIMLGSPCIAVDPQKGDNNFAIPQVEQIILVDEREPHSSRDLQFGKQLVQASPESSEAETVFWNEVKDSGDADMIEAFLTSFPNGKFAPDAKAKLQALKQDRESNEEAPTTEPDHVTRTVRAISVGKWPEGIGWDGESLWVAESGKRRLARINPRTEKVLNRVKVGRLPVDIVSTPSGQIFAMIATDKKIWRMISTKKGRTLGKLRDHPQALTGNDDTIWTLGWVNGSNAEIRISRFDVANGKRSESDILPGGGWDIIAAGDSVWSTHIPPGQENNTTLVVLDQQTLTERTRLQVDGNLRSLAFNGEAIFAAGYRTNGGGDIVKFDPKAQQEVARKALKGRLPFHMAVDEQHVVVIDRNAVISVLSAQNLTLLRTIQLEMAFHKDEHPKKILAFDGRLAFTVSDSVSNRNGRLIIVEDWRPEEP